MTTLTSVLALREQPQCPDTIDVKPYIDQALEWVRANYNYRNLDAGQTVMLVSARAAYLAYVDGFAAALAAVRERGEG
jgi:hypothetical protein